MRCRLTPKDVKQKFARRSAESSRRFAWSSNHPVGGSGPLNLEAATVKPSTQVAAAATNVAPQGRIHSERKAPGSFSIGSADVFVMNKELVQIRHSPDPPYAEQADGRTGPDPRDEPREVLALGQSGPAPLGEPLEGTRQNQARASDQIAFSQHDVCGKVMSSPALEQCWNRRAELIEEITELKALLRV
jgi:hypothetical protein